MALKRLKTKSSKRLPARQKYKILKKVREHTRKVRREAKKNNKKGSKKQKLIQIPNICPFKEEILKDVETFKKRQEEERLKRREILKSQNLTTKSNLEEMVIDAEQSAADFENNSKVITDESSKPISKDSSLKAYFKEFKKVVETADVILEIVDARDPLGTRCSDVEKYVKSCSGNKRLVLVLNKADLVPRENLDKWLKYLKKFGPVVVFKASTQDQNTKLGRRKLKQMNTDKAMQGSVCIGAELLMSILANYSRSNGIKTTINVGVVGIPNVGKSSIINSLTRGKSCSVGCVPGITKSLQLVDLDSKIKLLDCPGIVFSPKSNDSSVPAVLKNAQRAGDVIDPFPIAESILRRATKEYFCNLYDISEYNSYEEFYAKKAARMGKFLKGGIPDAVAAARGLLIDWNSGKIKYCTQPPMEQINPHISATIVNEDNIREFEIENFEAMETDLISKFDEIANVIEMKAGEPITGVFEEEKPTIIEEDTSKGKKRKIKEDDKIDPEMNLEGNQSINKSIKDLQKRRKKTNIKNEKKVSNVADILDAIAIDNYDDDKYDFDEDYTM